MCQDVTFPPITVKKPAAVRQASALTAAPTLTRPVAVPVVAVTTSDAAYSFEPAGQLPCPGLVTEPANETEPAYLPAQLIVPPVASPVPTRFAVP